MTRGRRGPVLRSLLVLPLVAAVVVATRRSSPVGDERSVGGALPGLLEQVPTSADTIRGSEDADVLSGTPGGDLLSGAGGDDVLRGLGGDDELQGGPGDDVLLGGPGSDVLEGGEGNDNLDGGAEQDWLFGDDGDDVLRGGDGSDIVDGGPGSDEILTGNGDDTADGGEGDDVLRGGDGDDVLDGSDGADILLGGSGNDDLDGGDGVDIVDGGPDDDTVVGGDAGDRLSGGPGNDGILGGDGIDFIDGGPGNDELSGGDGNDVVDGGAGDDMLQGSQGEDQLLGRAGEDILMGGPGADVLSGGPGADRLSGEDGDDRLEGGEDADELDGGLGTDHVIGGGGDDVVTLVAGDVGERRTEYVEGGAGADTLLLDGFGPADISEMVTYSAPSSDSVAAPELSFLLTDPYTGGGYRVSQVEVIRYVTRLPLAEGWGEGTTAVVLNTSTAPAEVAIHMRGPDGRSLARSAGDSTAGPWIEPIPPLGLIGIPGDGQSVPGSSTVELRSDAPLAAAALGRVSDLGPLGQADVSRLAIPRAPLEMDRDAGTTTALALTATGIARSVQIRLHAEDGGEPDSREIAVAADGHTFLRLDELFPGVQRFHGSAAIIGGPVSGSRVLVGPGDVVATALPLIPGAPDRQRQAPFYLPAAIGEGGRTTLTVLHRGPGPRGVGEVEFFDADGSPTAVEVEGVGEIDGVPFDLANFGSQRFSLAGASGWASVRMRVDSGSVAVVAHQTFGGTRAAQRGAAVVGDELVVPVPASASGGTTTYLATQSTGPAAEARLTLRGADGSILRGGTATLRIGADGSSMTPLAELLPDVVLTAPGGSLAVEASAPIAVSVLQLTESGSGLELPVRRLARTDR